MSPIAQLSTIEMYGKEMTYDPSKTYGIFTSQGKYGTLQLETALPKLANLRDAQEFLKVVEPQIENLNKRLAQSKNSGIILEGLVEEGILEIIGPKDPMEEEHRQAIQNTVNLFQYMAMKVRE